MRSMERASTRINCASGVMCDRTRAQSIAAGSVNEIAS